MRLRHLVSFTHQANTIILGDNSVVIAAVARGDVRERNVRFEQGCAMCRLLVNQAELHALHVTDNKFNVFPNELYVHRSTFI
jgi:hypothetical protein